MNLTCTSAYTAEASVDGLEHDGLDNTIDLHSQLAATAVTKEKRGSSNDLQNTKVSNSHDTTAGHLSKAIY